MGTRIRIAACHASPVFLSAKDTTRKAIGLIKQAAKQKANLVVFPETYIPAFPVWSSLRPPTENHDLFKRMALESVYADGEEMHDIRSAAKAANVMVSIGISEKVRTSSATLYNSNLLFGNDGHVLVHHRKLMPTFFEKLTWAPGDGFGLRVADTSFGKIGNLICGENTNPLARYTLMSQGEQVHISTWPAIWPTRTPGPQSDQADENQDQDLSEAVSAAANYDNVAANRIRAAAHCFEAKCFGVLCSGVLGPDAIETIATGSFNPQFVTHALEQSQRSATMFLNPTGALLQGFTVDEQTGNKVPTDFLQTTEDVLYADMDLADCIEGKQFHDVVGGYQRLDVFELRVDRSRRKPVNFVEEEAERSYGGSKYAMRVLSSSWL
ncbi:carbon-nitrogen hydrolase [Dactylonectria macrodidyma]|uniref:Carbon-nitrogen hydrolase n=1 Tax=Dactylonectria macrodidyma TaxID=307937 RepID=A0A9P9FM07_9HYPO|nr:carbon-nitrogen hydrolase [Dactylonectria macrodidyma]